MKWDFRRNGDLINLYVYKIRDGKMKGEVMRISQDDIKWKLDKTIGEIKIISEEFGIIANYKILSLNQSKIDLKKIN